MPHPYSFNYLQIIGDSFQSGDIWTTGIHLGITSGGIDEPTQASAAAAATIWKNFFTNLNSKFHIHYRTLSVKLNHFGTDGKQTTDPTIEHVYPTPILGTANGASMPPQCTLVGSLRAANSRGLASKGRMYLPITGAPIDASGKVAQATTVEINQMFAIFCRDLAASIDIPGAPILTSGAGLLGATNLVHEVALGDIYDTQRRRRNGFVETYATEVLDPPA